MYAMKRSNQPSSASQGSAPSSSAAERHISSTSST
jgi:hypothetical protein